MSIPRALHIVWIGDEGLRPASNIESWRRLNPALPLREWGNADFAKTEWRLKNHMRQLWSRELAGVADLMRYEILFNEGGITIDADSLCLRPLDDFLFEHDPFASWENEIARPGLISNAFVGAQRGNELIGAILGEIVSEHTLTDRMAWQATGPLRLTQCVQRLRYANLTIFPSHFFAPQHFTGQRYTGSGRIYCDHQWSSTHQLLKRGAY